MGEGFRAANKHEGPASCLANRHSLRYEVEAVRRYAYISANGTPL
jgi:hypothetical protein